MYKICQSEQSSRQQSAFIDKLLELMHQKPYDSITVKELCTQTGISRMTFYRLFDNKDDVLCALIDRSTQNLKTFRMKQEEIDPKVSSYFQHLYAYWYQHRSLLKIISDNGLISILVERSARHISSEDPEVLNRIGAMDNPYHKEVLAFYLSGITGLMFMWCRNGFEKSIVEMADITYQLMINPPFRTEIPLNYH